MSLTYSSVDWARLRKEPVMLDISIETYETEIQREEIMEENMEENIQEYPVTVR